jgi:hypothetical protein
LLTAQPSRTRRAQIRRVRSVNYIFQADRRRGMMFGASP